MCLSHSLLPPYQTNNSSVSELFLAFPIHAVLREAGVELELSKLQLTEGGGAPLELVSQVRCSWLKWVGLKWVELFPENKRTPHLSLPLSLVSSPLLVFQFIACVMDEEFEAASLLCEKSKSAGPPFIVWV